MQARAIVDVVTRRSHALKWTAAAAVSLATQIGCGGASCGGEACTAKVDTPPDAVKTGGADWTRADRITDCVNGGPDIQPDNDRLFYNRDLAANTPHRPLPAAENLLVGQPVLIWGAVCNKGAEASGQIQVSWARALCVDASNCPNPAPIGSPTDPGSVITSLEECTCRAVWLQDTTSPSEGLYQYRMLYQGQALAKVTTDIRNP
jgi:hypothetical protein